MTPIQDLVIDMDALILVGGGTSTGIEGCIICGEVTCSESNSGTCPSKDGQQDSTHLCTENGGYMISSAVGNSSGVVGFCPSADDFSLYGVSPRGREHPSGLGIPTYFRFQRLDVRPAGTTAS